MTRIVIVGEMFYSDLSVGGGPMPGYGGQPSHPIYNPPPGSPSHPIYNPAYPDQGLPGTPPGFWGGMTPHPDQGLPGQSPASPSHPIQGVPPGPSHPWVPPQGQQIPPPPDEIADSTVVAVWKPEAQAWTVTVYEPQPH